MVRSRADRDVSAGQAAWAARACAASLATGSTGLSSAKISGMMPLAARALSSSTIKVSESFGNFQTT